MTIQDDEACATRTPAGMASMLKIEGEGGPNGETKPRPWFKQPGGLRRMVLPVQRLIPEWDLKRGWLTVTARRICQTAICSCRQALNRLLKACAIIFVVEILTMSATPHPRSSQAAPPAPAEKP